MNSNRLQPPGFGYFFLQANEIIFDKDADPLWVDVTSFKEFCAALKTAIENDDLAVSDALAFLIITEPNIQAIATGLGVPFENQEDGCGSFDWDEMRAWAGNHATEMMPYFKPLTEMCVAQAQSTLNQPEAVKSSLPLLLDTIEAKIAAQEMSGRNTSIIDTHTDTSLTLRSTRQMEKIQ